MRPIDPPQTGPDPLALDYCPRHLIPLVGVECVACCNDEADEPPRCGRHPEAGRYPSGGCTDCASDWARDDTEPWITDETRGGDDET